MRGLSVSGFASTFFSLFACAASSSARDIAGAEVVTVGTGGGGPLPLGAGAPLPLAVGAPLGAGGPLAPPGALGAALGPPEVGPRAGGPLPVAG